MSANFVQIELPSRCITYGINPSTVKIKPLTGAEEELIAVLKQNVKKKLIQVFQSVLQGVDPKILTSGDANFIALWLVINSYSNKYPFRFACMNCGKFSDVSADLNKINSVELPTTFVPPGEVVVEGKKLKLRLPTLWDEIEILDYDPSGKSKHLYDYALTILPDDPEFNVVERVEFLRKAKGSEIQKIRDWRVKYTHGPDMQASIECPKCEYESEVLIPFRFDRFILTE
ncbi:MAG: hypothetical protein WC346_20990 [Methanogenium sp.]|jgi:hypothetical protein